MPTQVVGRRVAAYLIDAILLGVAALVVFLLVAHKVPKETAAGDVSTSLTLGDTKYQLTGAPAALYMAGYGLAWIVGRALFEHRLGATPGKLALGIRVVDAGGARPAFGAALLRNVLWVVDALPYVIGPIVGFVAALMSPSRQRIGDRVARTLVVRAGEAVAARDGERPAPGWYADPRGARRLRWWDGAAWTDDVAD